MTAPDPKAVATARPLLERVGVQYFARRSTRTARVVSTDAVHFINPEERRGMRRVQRGAIFRSCLAGAISATISAAAELVADPLLPEGSSMFSAAGLRYWALLGGVTLAAAIVEILFVYWDTLRSVHELARVAGLELFGRDRKTSDEALVDALARAALELPNPIIGPHGINPRREASKWRLIVASLAYKAKVGVTNFLVKLLVRRILGRVFVRSVVSSFVPFVAVPITAAWNGVVTWWVLREARIRAMGPSAAGELVDLAFAEVPQPSPEGRLSAVRAVAAAIVRTQDLHPNLLALLDKVTAKAGDTGAEELDDVGEFLSGLRSLSAAERRLSLQVLGVAVIVDGRLTPRERRLWQDALAAAGRPIDFSAVEQLQTAFVQGDGVAEGALRAI